MNKRSRLNRARTAFTHLGRSLKTVCASAVLSAVLLVSSLMISATAADAQTIIFHVEPFDGSENGPPIGGQF